MLLPAWCPFPFKLDRISLPYLIVHCNTDPSSLFHLMSIFLHFPLSKVFCCLSSNSVWTHYCRNGWTQRYVSNGEFRFGNCFSETVSRENFAWNYFSILSWLWLGEGQLSWCKVLWAPGQWSCQPGEGRWQQLSRVSCLFLLGQDEA